MTLVISKGITLAKANNGIVDPDAIIYINNVEKADGENLEYDTAKAIHDFVVGCKADGIWDAIKASCILAGARTLTGALVPLVGTAPTNVGGLFVSGDYNRKTGLMGNGSSKYLDTNRNNNADPQDNKHLSVYVTDIGGSNKAFLGAGGSSGGASTIFHRGVGTYIIRNNASTLFDPDIPFATGFIGASRSLAASFNVRLQSTNYVASTTSETPFNGNYFFARAGTLYGDGRAAFYSIGENLNLALLDARVTDLINTIGAAIP
jgi:hypothetical protein